MSEILIEIIQNSGGRTGHKMKDYLTAFCFYFICDYKIIDNDYWNFPKNDCNNHLDMFNLKDNSNNIFVKKSNNNNYITLTYSLKNMIGMDFITFKNIINKIENVKNTNTDKKIIISLSNATRIQLSDVYNWEISNLIKKGTYNKITSYLRERFLNYSNSIQIPIIKSNTINISIHIRKGDVHTRILHISVEYYKIIINNLKKIKKLKYIYIYTEKWNNYNGNDVFNLKYLEDDLTKIQIIFKECLYEYFINMINSDIFVCTIGQGSLSDLVIHYKNKNTIIILNHELRQNKFNDNMDNTLIKTDYNGNFKSSFRI